MARLLSPVVVLKDHWLKTTKYAHRSCTLHLPVRYETTGAIAAELVGGARKCVVCGGRAKYAPRETKLRLAAPKGVNPVTTRPSPR